MRRAEPLIPFSHDHHHGLVVCRRIREGLKRNIDPARIARYVRNFWHRDLQKHFEEEEEMLFPLVRTNTIHVNQALSEHRQLRDQMEGIAADDIKVLADTLEPFASLLDSHIRFEERILFPQIEREVPLALLAEVNSKLQKEQSPDSWPDEFWNENTER